MRRLDQLDGSDRELMRSLQRQFELALPRLQRMQAQLGIDQRAWYRRVLGGNIVAGEAEIAANELAAKEIVFVTELFRSLPGASDYSDFEEVLTGVDLVTGEELSNFQYTVTVVGAVIPFAGSAPLRKFAGKFTKATGEGVAKAVDATQSASKKAACGGTDAGNKVREITGGVRRECFAPNTPVQTPTGLRRIDEIQVGDWVRAFDFDVGEWVDRQVEHTDHGTYEGTIVSIVTEAGAVRATAYHPFWVVEGADLAERPQPRELREHESEGKSLAGRWVNSHDLRPGDLLASADGSTQRILRIEQEYSDHFSTVNLTILSNHSYAVGSEGLLVHNEPGCPPVNGYLPDIPGGTLKSFYFNSEGEARHYAMSILGKNPVNIGDNKLRSVNGRWQYRAKTGDVIGDARGPHVHIERLDPETGQVLENLHLRWPPLNAR